ncbi:MAG: class I SAM-dependent methyltransferase [Actinomycetota bacterium]|nr:class I SAM-dependent methyltransferase [Actinomycetota bacterium]
MSVDDVAARGFGSASDAYERGRPSYPAEAVTCLIDELSMAPGSTVVEVAAGTGKLTRLLTPSGARVVAVEPVAEMRRVLVDKVPGVDVVAGTAEALPLASGSADAVVVAQAFHWFAVPEALAEMARVLRPGGGFGLVWNDRDDSVPWVAELSALIQWDDRPVPSYHQVDWTAAVEQAGAFGPLEHRQFHLEQQLDVDTLVDRVLSTSYLASRPATEQDKLATQVRRLVADMPDRFVLPYRTDVYWCHRR